MISYLLFSGCHRLSLSFGTQAQKRATTFSMQHAVSKVSFHPPPQRKGFSHHFLAHDPRCKAYVASLCAFLFGLTPVSSHLHIHTDALELSSHLSKCQDLGCIGIMNCSLAALFALSHPLTKSEYMLLPDAHAATTPSPPTGRFDDSSIALHFGHDTSPERH